MAKRWTFKNKDVTFVTELNFDLGEWEDSLSTDLLQSFLKKADNYLKSEVNKRFITETGPDGKKWKKLSRITKRLKKGYTHVLIWKQRLMRSITSAIYGDELIIFTKVPYSKIQQKGATYSTTPKQSFWLWHHAFRQKGHPFKPRKIRIPARPFLGFGRKNVNELNRLLKREVMKSERLGTYGVS